MKSTEASPVPLGSQETSNKRTIYKFIHQGGIQSCQLVMGLTALEPGNVWNSFPPHTHWRRTEIYFYFDLGANVLSHFLGEPQETRHLFLHNEERGAFTELVHAFRRWHRQLQVHLGHGW